jgi:hypothetical protein
VGRIIVALTLVGRVYFLTYLRLFLFSEAKRLNRLVVVPGALVRAHATSLTLAGAAVKEFWELIRIN